MLYSDIRMDGTTNGHGDSINITPITQKQQQQQQKHFAMAVENPYLRVYTDYMGWPGPCTDNEGIRQLT